MTKGKTQLLLKYKTLLQLWGLVAVSILSIYVILQTTLVPSLIKIEKEDHIKSTKRVLDAFEEDHNQLRLKQADVAAWDDTYEFILNPNDKTYIESNIEGAVFEGLDTDLVLFKDKNYNTRYFYGIDPTTKEPFKTVPPPIENFFSTHKNIITWSDINDYKVGFISDGTNIFQVSGRPITNSLMTEEPRGTLIYIRFMNAERLQRFEEITQYKIELHALNTTAGEHSKGITIQPVNNQEVSGLAPLKDLTDKTVGQAGVISKRHIYLQGKKTLNVVMWLSVLLCSGLAVIIWILFKFLIFDKLHKISSKIIEAKNQPDPDIMDDLAHLGEDEIGNVAKKIDELYREVRKLADTDELTGVNNVRYFKNMLAHHIKFYKRHLRQSSLILFDIDHFKKINDTYGHLQGDYVLKTIGNLLTKYIRSTDVIARYGGEEFAMLLRETDIQGAMRVAEKLRSEVENLEIPLVDFSKEPIKITISLGLSRFSPDIQSPEEIIKRSDDALYAAKKSGRNRAMVFSQQTM